MQAETKPSISDAFAIMTALARSVAPLGDATMSQLTAQIGARVARITPDSDPDELRAIIEMLNDCDAVMARLAKQIDVINTVADGTEA